MKHTCQHCGGEFSRIGNAPYKYCSQSCMGKESRQTKNPNWKGGTYRPDGYKLVYASDGRRMREQRLVMEQVLGRPLKDTEIVHHLDGNPRNNTPENLSITNRARHMVVHATYRGPKRKQCSVCLKIKSRSEFTRKNPKKPTHDTHDSQCKACNAARKRKIRLLALPLHD